MLNGSTHRGFTLIEALIALAVMLVGLAGGAALLLRTVHQERDSAWRRFALRQSASMAEEIRALRGSGPAASAGEAAAIDVWRTQAVAELPAGATADVTSGADGDWLRISIAWVTADGTQQFVLPVQP